MIPICAVSVHESPESPRRPGFASQGAAYVADGGYVTAALGSTTLVLGIPHATQYNVPVLVPCYHPVSIPLFTNLDQPIATATCPTGPGRGDTVPFDHTISDDVTPPSTTGASVNEGDTDVDPLSDLTVTFDEPISAASCELLNIDLSPTVSWKGRCEVANNVVQFIPDIHMHYSTNYRLRMFAVKDLADLTTAEIDVQFKTFTPRILQHLDNIDANDVVWVDPVSIGRSPCDDLIAVAEGDALKPDIEGGLRLYDVTDLSQPPVELSHLNTTGADRSVAFVSGTITTKADPDAAAVDNTGGFLMSVDGEGDPGRLGVWRLSKITNQGASIERMATRFLSQSDENIAQMIEYENGGDPLQSVSNPLRLVPLVGGLPLSVAAIGTTVALTSTITQVGVNGIFLQNLDTRTLAGRQVDSSMPGFFRAVTPLHDKVLAVGQSTNDNVVVLTDAGFNNPKVQQLSVGGQRLWGVTGLTNWKTRPYLGAPASAAEQREYAVALGDDAGLPGFAKGT